MLDGLKCKNTDWRALLCTPPQFGNYLFLKFIKIGSLMSLELCSVLREISDLSIG